MEAILPPRNKLEELNKQLYEELSKEPCSEVTVNSLTDQIRELEETSDCFGHAKDQSSTNQAVLAAEPPEASKNVRISEQAEIREFEVERISKSTATRQPLVVETPKGEIIPFSHPVSHPVDLEESGDEQPLDLFGIITDKTEPEEVQEPEEWAWNGLPVAAAKEIQL